MRFAWFFVVWMLMVGYRVIWTEAQTITESTIARFGFEVLAVCCGVAALQLYASHVHNRAVQREQASKVQSEAQAGAGPRVVPYRHHAADDGVVEGAINRARSATATLICMHTVRKPYITGEFDPWDRTQCVECGAVLLREPNKQ